MPKKPVTSCHFLCIRWQRLPRHVHSRRSCCPRWKVWKGAKCGKVAWRFCQIWLADIISLKVKISFLNFLRQVCGKHLSRAHPAPPEEPLAESCPATRNWRTQIGETGNLMWGAISLGVFSCSTGCDRLRCLWARFMWRCLWTGWQ